MKILQQSELEKWWETFEPIEFIPSDEIEVMSFRKIQAYLARLNSDRRVMIQRLGLAKDETHKYSDSDFELSKEIRKALCVLEYEIGKVSAWMHLLSEDVHELAIELEKVKLDRDRVRIDAEIRKEELKLEREKLKNEMVQLQIERDSQQDRLFYKVAKEVLPNELYMQIWEKVKNMQSWEKARSRSSAK